MCEVPSMKRCHAEARVNQPRKPRWTDASTLSFFPDYESVYTSLATRHALIAAISRTAVSLPWAGADGVIDLGVVRRQQTTRQLRRVRAV